ncbi:MAG: PEP-CTERM sorting domain-containing protein [Planctomycetota bacterium]
MSFPVRLIVVVSLGLLVTLPASAEIIYSDTFSRETGSGDGNGDPNGAADNFSDWGNNDNGLGGTVSQAWIAGPSRPTGGRNAVTDGNLGISHGTSAIFDFDVTSVAPNGFSIALDFGRFVTPPDPSPGAGGYIAFGLGVDSGTAPTDFTALGSGDFSLLFQQANNGNAANAEAWEDGASVSAFDYLTPDVPHTLLLTVIPEVAGQYGDTDAIGINVLVDGTLSQDFNVTGGADFGTFTVSANQFDTRFIDNLIVTAVPEPGTLAALSALSVAGLIRRRRRG